MIYPDLYFKPRLRVINDDQIQQIHLPAWMVEDAIRTAPARVVLGRRDGTRSVFLEGDKSWFGPSVDCIDYLDPITDERWRFTSDDCRITSTVADALPNYSWVMTIGMAGDVPAEIADRGKGFRITGLVGR